MGSTYVEFKLKEVEQLASLLNSMSLTAEQERQLLAGIGKEMESGIQTRIADTKTDPDGKRWDDIKESTRKYYNKKNIPSGYRNLLHRRGNLRDSVESQVKTGSVLVGATMSYASYVNDGTKKKDGSEKMVSRRFIGIGQTDIQLLLSTVQNFLRGVTA